MNVWCCGKYIDMEIGQKVLVFKCGSGRTIFGEYATLTRTTKTQLVFVTESGVTIKTRNDNLHYVVGKAGKQDWTVTPNIAGRDEDPNFIECPVFVY